MARPALHARELDASELVKLVRAALRHEEAAVRVAEPPRGDVSHTLLVESPTGRRFSLAAEPLDVPADPAVAGSEPVLLRLSPLDPLHVPELETLLRELADPPPVSSAIFDSAPPLPESPQGPLGSVTGSFDPEAALIGRAPEGVHEADADMLTIPFRASKLPPSMGAGAGADSVVHTMRELPPLRSAFDESPIETNREWPEAPASSTGPGFRVSLPPETELAPVEEHTVSTASMRSPRTRRGSEIEIPRGRRIAGKYEVDTLVGAGAVGAVYRALHAELGRTVAIKVLHPYYRTDPNIMAAFRTEARAASRLQHPNVTVVHDFGEEPDGLVYIVMEYLEGRTLQSVLDTEQRLPPRRALSIMMEVCAALAAAHDWGIVHRDVKPDNIILVPVRDDDDGKPHEVVKVCDFGIAALDAAPPSDDDDTMTAGTPEYMAPEQIAGHADARTDQYACGVVLYELLGGAPPFTDPSVSVTLERHAKEAPRRLDELVPAVKDVTAALQAAVLRALEKKPERRFGSMRELRLELKRCLAALPPALT